LLYDKKPGRPEGCRPLWKNLFTQIPFSFEEKGIKGMRLLAKTKAYISLPCENPRR
jgi:hypothetical protein